MNPRDLLLAPSQRKPLDGFKGAFIAKLSLEQVEALGNGSESSSARLFQMAVVDEGGSPLFQPSEIGLVKSIEHERFGALLKQIMAFNGMTDDATENAAKN